MLQEFLPERRRRKRLGTGVKVCFQCEDALALIASSNRAESRGNVRLWETACGLCRLLIPTAIAWSFQAPLIRRKSASSKNNVDVAR